MLTGRAAELRPDVNYLQPRRIFMPLPDQPQRTFGSNEQTLREQCRVANIRRAQAKAARPRKPGAIPTSGRARSDAKRNQRAESAKVRPVRTVPPQVVTSREIAMGVHDSTDFLVAA